MRIVTDGKKFAIVRGRWIFTEFLNHIFYEWEFRFFGLHEKFPDLYWMNSLEEAQKFFQHSKKVSKKKYWNVK